MSEQTAPTPLAWASDAIMGGWRSLKTIYYANTMSWRFLKSGALLFFGFFLWSASNLLLSVQPGWTVLRYIAAYGFILIPYGPFHHLVVIPLALRWRRAGGKKTTIGRRLPNTGLALFLIAVIVLGTFPAGPMLFDFGSSIGGDSADVNPDMLCTQSTVDGETIVHCHLSESEGIDHVEVQSGGETVLVDRQPPFQWEMNANQLQEVTGQKQFQVVLRDEDGDMIRRYVRTMSSIESE